MKQNMGFWLVLASFLVSIPLAQAQFAIESRLTGNPSHSYHPSPSDWRDVNMYQLFTDRFFDGNTGNNLARSSTLGVPWYNQSGSIAENDRHLFQGGDWNGVRQKLPYLEGMGVNCIWISGVQLNEQGTDKRFTPYHAYHPTDFYQVEPMFGTFQELTDLIDDAHGRGIYVMIDVVVNHTADLLKYTDCDCNYTGYCANNCASLWWWDTNVQVAHPFNDPQWFHNNGTMSGSDYDTYPNYVEGAFLGTEDLRTEDPYVQGELKNIFKHLIDATDCDGFRVDAIKHMDYNFIKDWANDMRVHASFRGKSNFLLFGEYFSYDDGIQASYCKDPGYSFNSTLWFPMQLTMKNVFANEQGTQQLGDRLNALGQYGEAADKVVAFMDNHDVDRFALECGSQWEAKMRPALTFLYLGTPVPCLFYGTEHGFNQGDRRNGPPDQALADFQREVMFDFGFQWGNAFGDKFYASPLYNHIAALNQLRRDYDCLRRGSLTQRWQSGGAGLFAFTKTLGEQEALVVLNTDWNNQSANPQVSRPDGTVYENLLNPGETVTVSGGTLSVSLNGKESKVFVAGGGRANVETSCTVDTLTVSYEPRSGPLSSPVGSLHLEIDAADLVMTWNGSAWTADYALSNATSEVTFSFRDEDTPPTVDDHDGQDWTVDVEFCGQLDVDLAWIGALYTWPGSGDWDVGEDLWVNLESWPPDAVADGEVVYSIVGDTNWNSIATSFNGVVGNNDTWHANLGAHSAGTTLEFAVRLTGRNGDFWENNGGTNHFISVNAGATTVTGLSGTRHWPENGNIEPNDDIWVDIESAPVGAGVSGEVISSTDGGASWQSVALSHNGIANNKDLWHANLGGFASEATVRYAVKVTDGDGTDHWDNNGGTDFIAEVNAASSSLRWMGNTVSGGVQLPWMSILGGALPMLELQGLESGGMYSIYESLDLQGWLPKTSVVAVAATEMMPSDPAESVAFYAVQPDWVPAGQAFSDDELLISIETWPAGGATAANLVYTTDGGATWHTAAMRHAGTRGNNDVWTASLGNQPIGATIQYAIEVVDDQSESHWDNNQGMDFTLTIYDPNQTDFQAPTTGYSPQDTTVADPTLDVTLTATDDLDPNPVIHYTTDGSTPTTTSSVYGAAITVTDQGSGVDQVIKFFARDASGNESAVTSIDVKVNDTFAFGGMTPYSSNPTLGQAVANGAITADGVNNGEWDDNKLIALDMVNDDPRSVSNNWTMHEAPIDLTHLWAAWDDNNLYLAWQYADVTDIIDGANAGGAGSGRIGSNDGILQWIALDTAAGGATLDVWGKNNGMPYWTGSELPDVQIYMAGSLWQGYLSRAQAGVFPVDDGGINYFAAAAAGITYGTDNTFQGSAAWGVGDADDRGNAGSPNRNFLTEGHDTSRDSFYEIAIPLATLQVTRAQLESTGIGVMLAAGSESAMDSLPHDETTLDTLGVETYNSSFEWGDTDSFTTPFARIGSGG